MNRNVVLAAVVALGAVLSLYMALSRPEPAPQPQATAPAAMEPEPAPAPAPTPTPVPPPPPAAAPQPTPPPPAAAENDPTPTPTETKPPVRTGPLDDLKREYQTEPRASAAHDLEQYIESEFKKPHIPQGLFKSALCRTDVCKVQVHWQPDRNVGYGLALMPLLTTFELSVGVDPDTPDKNGAVEIDVYLKKRAVPITRNLAPPAEQPH